MRVSLKTINGVISFSEPTAKIVAIAPSGDSLYKIFLNVDVSKALKNNANIIDITVYAEDPGTFKVVQPGSDPGDMTRAILYSSADQKSAALIRANKVIATTKIDITSKVDNSQIAAIKAGKSPKDGSKLYEVSAVQKTNSTTSTSQASRIYSALNILQAGIDPSTANRTLTTTTQSNKVIAGLLEPTKPQYESGVSARLHDLVFRPGSLTSGSVGTRRGTAKKKGAQMVGEFLVPAAALAGQQHFFAVARLTSVAGQTVSEVKTRIDHALCLKAFNTPKHPPEVTLTDVHSTGLLNFEIRQVDPHATRVGIFRRVTSHVDIAALRAGYTKIAEINVSHKDGKVKFTDTSPGAKLAIYRFTAVGASGIAAGDFSSVVYRPTTRAIRSLNRRSIFKTVTVTAQNADTGIIVELNSLPGSASSIGVLRRDMTLNETVLEFLDISSPIVRIDDPTSTIVFTDTSTKVNHIYEYSCKMYTRDGSEHQCIGSVIVKRNVASGTGIQLTLSNISVDKGTPSPDVKFNLKSATMEGLASKTLSALVGAGLSTIYNTEIESGKSDLNDLITHNVTRVDTVTGDTADFGTIVGDSFSDITSRTSSVTVDVVPGRKYRYVVSTQLRSADSLLKERTIEKTDKFGRSWSFEPWKYLNPITLKTGTLLPNDGTMVHHPEDEFKQGALGNESFIEVTLPDSVSSLSKASASKSLGQNVVKWSLSGNADNYDHFEVFSVADGIVRSVGRVQSAGNPAYEFVASDDDTATKYVVVPVMTDFTQGTYVTVDVV